MDKKNIDYWKSLLDEIWLEQITMIHKGKDIEAIIGFAFMNLLSQPERLERSDASDFKRLVNSWLSKTKAEKKNVKLIDLTNI